jgi:PAS domain-containing protein
MLSHAHAELQGAEYVVFADVHRRYTDCSEAVCRLLGYSRHELLRMTIDDVSYSADVSKRFEQFIRQGSQDGEFVLRHKNGSPVPIRYQSFVFTDGCCAASWSPVTDWREPYLAALLELDTAKLKGRVEVALAAVQRQIHELNTSSPASPHDRQALRDALTALQALQRTR